MLVAVATTPLLSFLTQSLPFIPIVVAKLGCPWRPQGTVGECGVWEGMYHTLNKEQLKLKQKISNIFINF